MRLVPCVAFLTLALVAVACGSPVKSTPIDPRAYELPERMPPMIRVLEPGFEPREVLRYTIPPDDVERLYIDIAMAGQMQAGDEVEQSFGPPVRLTVEMGPTELAPKDRIRQPIRITEIAVADLRDQADPSMARQIELLTAQVQQQWAPLLQVKGWTDMDRQGIVRVGKFDAVDDVAPRIRTMLGNIRTALISVPFPEEPIGLRARWDVTHRLSVHGIMVEQTVTYTLLEKKGNQLGLQVTARQSAKPQAMDGGRLEAYESSIIGSAALRLDHFTPFSEAESTTNMRSTVPVGGEVALVRAETKAAVRVYPAEADSAPPAVE